MSDWKGRGGVLRRPGMGVSRGENEVARHSMFGADRTLVSPRAAAAVLAIASHFVSQHIEKESCLGSYTKRPSTSVEVETKLVVNLFFILFPVGHLSRG